MSFFAHQPPITNNVACHIPGMWEFDDAQKLLIWLYTSVPTTTVREVIDMMGGNYAHYLRSVQRARQRFPDEFSAYLPSEV